MQLDLPKSLKDINELKKRRDKLEDSHMISLKEYTEQLRKKNLGEIPNFDPMDGGKEAGILFLFEKPGPMTALDGGSGFISRNNDDPTAENTFKIMSAAGIPRKITCTWNLVPGWNKTTKVKAQERIAGRECLRDLINILPKLKVIVLVGNTAKSAKKKLEEMPIIIERCIEIRTSYHPAKRVENRYPEKFATIKIDWANAYEAMLRALKN